MPWGRDGKLEAGNTVSVYYSVYFTFYVDEVTRGWSLPGAVGKPLFRQRKNGAQRNEEAGGRVASARKAL
ncbi:hypothetical protein DXT99_20255 [Pontibacter diazotrophicus]|uniref:Uncharacterized protein n=1 Tax=Pontibacter diazotrophicus TaxID=1400979 RepID=A0A3D8L7P8_9BACT|nr:hypothetical protein DXT99_20255 [Pontibacter diazotrophicus]